MPPISVRTLCAYYTSDAGVALGATYDAIKFVKAIKGDALNRYATVPVLGRRLRLDQSNRDEAIGWAGEMVAQELRKLPLPGRPVVLVPIPGSACDSAKKVAEGRVFKIAAAAAGIVGAGVAPLCWWKAPMASARKGGTRDLATLLAWLRVRPADSRSAASTVVLVDDVLTTGAHVRACAARLDGTGYNVAGHAICVARTVHEEEDDPFRIDDQSYPSVPDDEPF